MNTWGVGYVYDLLREEVYSVLRDAWEATLCMGGLDIEPEAKEHYDSQRERLRKILWNANISISDSTDFKIETDTESYQSCRNLDDYQAYLQRFPKGKHKAEAQKKIEEIKKKKEEERLQLLHTIVNSNSLDEAVAMRPKCKDNSTLEALDDKCFELCESKSDYQKYIVSFGSEAKHAAEAEEHLKFDRMKEKIQSYFYEHQGRFVTILIVLVIIILGVLAGLKFAIFSFLIALAILVNLINE